MSSIAIGTDKGAFRVGPSGSVTFDEGGPASVKFLARTYTGVAAVTEDDALWVSDRQGSWRLVNAKPVPDDVWAFGSDPRLDGRLYIGVSPALLYISSDGGASWKACDSIKRIPGYDTWTFPPPPHTPHVRSIAPDPHVVGAVYIGVEEGGVYRSDDDGVTWQSLNEGLYWDVHTIVPTGGRRLYATTGDGFHRSEDSGGQWQHISAGLDRSYTIPFLVSEQQGLVYTAAAAAPPPFWGNGANAALYRSRDGGDSWQRLENGLPDRFDVMVYQLALDDKGRVFAASGASVYVSDDGGDSWRTIADGLPPVNALVVI